MSLTADLRRLGRAATPTWARTAVGRSLAWLAGVRVAAIAAAEARLYRDPPPLAAIPKGPLVYSGFLDEVLGLGRAGRLAVSAIEEAGFPVVRHGVRPLLTSLGRAAFPVAEPGGVWVLHCNAPEARTALAAIRRKQWRGRYLIGYWAWELEALPEDWTALAGEFHEIWVLSNFMAEAVRPYAREVRVMWPRMPDLSHVQGDPARFGLEPGRVHFATLADARSALARKNPRAAIEAYRRAFPEPTDMAVLTVKLVEPVADPEGVGALHALADGRPDIRFYVEDLSDAEMSAFMASIDVLVSLHRSEGFGLGIAEAMALRKATVATAWSANLDFTSGDAAEGLVPYTLVPVDDPSGRYRGGHWADADVDAAGRLIRRLAEDDDFRRRVGTAGPASVEVLKQPWRPEALAAQAWGPLVDR